MRGYMPYRILATAEERMFGPVDKELLDKNHRIFMRPDV